jgi:ankyrin repeat protein
MSAKNKPASDDSFDQAIAEFQEPAPKEPASSHSTKPPLALTEEDAFFIEISSRSADVKSLIQSAKTNPKLVAHVDAKGFNALTLALLNKKNDLALALAELGSDVNQASREMGWTPISLACGANEGEDSLAKLLLSKGANPNQAQPYAPSAMVAACTFGNASLAAALAKAGAEINPVQVGWPPIIAAAGSGNLKLVDLLLSLGADPKAQISDRNAFGALHQAVKGRNLDVVERFIEKGCSLNAMNLEGDTPLHFAAERGLEAIAKRLIKAGANPALENIAGKTASELATDAKLKKLVAVEEASRVKHPLYGKKRGTVIGEAPEPGVKKKKEKKESSASAKTKPAAKKIAKPAKAKPELAELTQASAKKIVAKKSAAKKTAKKNKAK